MELHFADAKLADLCSSQGQLVREYGPQMACSICARLHEVEAAATLAELRHLPHSAMRARAADPRLLSIDLGHSHCLILRTGGDGSITGNTIDWDGTVSVVVMEIADVGES